MCKKQTNKQFFNEAKSYQILKATPPENLTAFEPKKGPNGKGKHLYIHTNHQFQGSNLSDEPTKKSLEPTNQPSHPPKVRNCELRAAGAA